MLSKTSQSITISATPAAMQPPSLQSCLRQADDYDFEILTAAKNGDTCVLCNVPYVASGRSIDEDCSGVRLNSCGHIVGQECFETWVNAHDGICPCWKQGIPPRRRWSTWPTDLLHRFCFYLIFMRSLAFAHRARKQDPTFALALYSLSTNRLTLSQALYLAKWYIAYGMRYSSTLCLAAFLLYTGIFSILSLLYMLLVGIISPQICLGRGCEVWSYIFWVERRLARGTVIFMVLWSSMYVMLVFSVLAVSRWRSYFTRYRNR